MKDCPVLGIPKNPNYVLEDPETQQISHVLLIANGTSGWLGDDAAKLAKNLAKILAKERDSVLVRLSNLEEKHVWQMPILEQVWIRRVVIQTHVQFMEAGATGPDSRPAPNLVLSMERIR